MIYENKRKIKKIFAMLSVSAFIVSSVMSCFSFINKVDASIKWNLSVLYISGDFLDCYFFLECYRGFMTIRQKKAIIVRH